MRREECFDLPRASGVQAENDCPLISGATAESAPSIWPSFDVMDFHGAGGARRQMLQGREWTECWLHGGQSGCAAGVPIVPEAWTPFAKPCRLTSRRDGRPRGRCRSSI